MAMSIFGREDDDRCCCGLLNILVLAKTLAIMLLILSLLGMAEGLTTLNIIELFGYFASVVVLVMILVGLFEDVPNLYLPAIIFAGIVSLGYMIAAIFFLFALLREDKIEHKTSEITVYNAGMTFACLIAVLITFPTFFVFFRARRYHKYILEKKSMPMYQSQAYGR